jgi:hypothetical protein
MNDTKKAFLAIVSMLAIVTTPAVASYPLPVDVVTSFLRNQLRIPTLVVHPRSSSTPVVVDHLPSSMTQSWCYTGHQEKFDVYGIGDCHRDSNDSWMTIDPMRFDAHELTCNVDKIWRLVRGHVYRLKMRCAAEGSSWIEKKIVQIPKNGRSLWVRTEWCD